MLKVDYKRLVVYTWQELHEVLPPLIAAPIFPVKFLYVVVACQWGWFQTNRSDLASRMISKEAPIWHLELVRDRAQARVDKGLIGYKAWVEFIEECIATRKDEESN